MTIGWIEEFVRDGAVANGMEERPSKSSVLEDM